MGPSLDWKWGVLRTNPTMLFLTLNPAIILYGTRITWTLLAIGSLAALINTRLGVAFGLLALLFVDFNKDLTKWERFIFAMAAFVYFIGQLWMMYQGFVLGWITPDPMGG